MDNNHPEAFYGKIWGEYGVQTRIQTGEIQCNVSPLQYFVNLLQQRGSLSENRMCYEQNACQECHGEHRQEGLQISGISLLCVLNAKPSIVGHFVHSQCHVLKQVTPQVCEKYNAIVTMAIVYKQAQKKNIQLIIQLSQFLKIPLMSLNPPDQPVFCF